MEYPGTPCAYQKAQNVYGYHHGNRKLDLQPHLHTDYQGQGHGKNRQQQLVIYACKTAAESDGCMQYGKYMYNPG